jgi:hypothetical protein
VRKFAKENKVDLRPIAFTVIDRMRTNMLHRVGLDELLIPVEVNSERRVEKSGSTAAQ